MDPRKEKKGKPALSLENRVFLAVLKTADSLSQRAEQFLKAHGLTAAQYNVLRILRGAEPQGLACRQIGERMISHDPDMTRLLDRMEQRGLISRQRGKEDRRVVHTRITAHGLKLLKQLDEPVRSLHCGQFQHMRPASLKLLAQLLDEVCNSAPK